MDATKNLKSGLRYNLVLRQIKPNPLQIILFGFLAVTVIFFVHTGLAFAQDTPIPTDNEHLPGNPSIENDYNGAILNFEASENILPDEVIVKFRQAVSQQKQREALARVASRENMGRG